MTPTTRYLEGEHLPALNVKTHGLRFPTIQETAEHFKCDEADAERALEFAVEAATGDFWRMIQEIAKDHFPDFAVGVWQDGRSGGWLVVGGLPYAEDWDADMQEKWDRFAADVRADMKYRASKETLFEDIEANDWAKPMSERYNFVDTPNGKVVCLADVNAATAAFRKDYIERGARCGQALFRDGKQVAICAMPFGTEHDHG